MALALTAIGTDINNAHGIISVYVLALGISTPLAGFLADRFGIKRVYLGGLGIFALSSLVCGLAPSPPSNVGALLAQACRGNIAGFEKAYTLTFLAACLAFVLGLMLPGWPRKWGGRRAADVPSTPH